MLERCTICSEKAEVTVCGHCDKKVCEECKNAHIQIMQRELARLNSQIRRALTRFNEELGQLKKCDDKLKISCDQARTSIVDLAANLIGLIKEKEKQLLKELDDFQQSEDVNIKKLREGVDDEYNNLVANCELIEKNVLNLSASKQANQSNLNLSLNLEDEDTQNESMQWSDLELVEYREIFLKTLEFLRNFETLDGMEYARSALKLDVIKDLDQLRKQTANYASLKVQYLATEKLQLQQQLIAQLAAGLPLNQTGSPNFAQQLGSTHALNQAGTAGTQLNIPTSQQSILIRSQSDHRLATQFAKKELLLQKQQQANAGKYGTTNYGSNFDENDLNSQYGVSSYYGPGGTQPGSTQYRSRFMREKNAELMHDSEDPYSTYRGVRFDEQSGLQNLTAAQLAVQLQNAFKVFDTKEASRCPLSSVVKLNESMHFMERIEENKRKAKKLEKEKAELKKMSQPPKQPQTNPVNNTSTNLTQSHQQQTGLVNRQSPNQQINLTSTQPQQPQNKQPPNRQISEDEIDKQKRLNKQFEMQSLNAADNANVNTQPSSQSVQGIGALSQQQTQQTKQVLQKQNSMHGPEPTLQQTQLPNNLLVNSPHHHHQTRLNQTSSGPDDEEDEEIEDSVEEEDSEDEDETNLPGHQNTRQVISSSSTQHTNNNSNKLSGQQRPSFEESESKLMPVTALADHPSNDYVNKNSSSMNTRRLSNSFDQQNSLMNIGRTSSIDRDYGQTTGNSGYTSSGNKLSRQNSTNSPNVNQANIGTLTTPRNSIDIGSTGYNTGSRSNSFDRENGTSSYRYLTRANTRLDDLLNRDSYANDNSTTSSNHNRFNRFNRLARSSTVSSLSPSYTGTSSSNTSSNSGGSNSSGSSNYRTYDLDNTGSNYLTGSSAYSSNRNQDSSYLNIRSRPSSPPSQSRLNSTGSSTNASSLSRYGIGNSSVGTSSGYRRPSAYTPDTSQFTFL